MGTRRSKSSKRDDYFDSPDSLDEFFKSLEHPRSRHNLRKLSDVKIRFQNFVNRSDVRKAIRFSSTMIDSIVDIVEHPTPAYALKAVVHAAKMLADDVELWPDAFFAGDEWVSPFADDFDSIIIDSIKHFPLKELRTADEDTVVRLYDLGDDLIVGSTFSTKISKTESVYVRVSQLEKVQEKIKQALWKLFDGNSLVMRYVSYHSVGSKESRLQFDVDDIYQSHHSERAEEYASYLKRCFDGGCNRNLLFYGPPGTGKSTLARTLVDKLNFRSFRICVSDVSAIDASTLYDAISIFNPDALILDDFDRCHEHTQSAYLEILDSFSRNVKLVIATVNDKSKLDKALLRPERFDELIHVATMDEAVVKHVLGQYQEGFEFVKSWPIVFVKEYVKRRQFMSPEETKRSMIELAARVASMSATEEESDGWEALNEKVKDTDQPPPTELFRAGAR